MVHRKHTGKLVLENDTEHSYNLTITAWYSAQQFPKLDKDLIIRYALVHDIVEAYAGVLVSMARRRAWRQKNSAKRML